MASTHAEGPPHLVPSMTPLLHAVADERRPGNFADIAEKVEPAVISVSSKVAPQRRESTLDRPFGPGAPDQSAPNEEIPKGPDQGDQGQDHEASKAGQMTTSGSGFFISADGYAVTNSKVVEGGGTARIRTNDGKIYTAKVVGRDALSDLALIKVDDRTDFSYVTFAEQPPRVGDWVLAVGNRFGLGGTVTAGIVSARERNIEVTGAPDDLLQISAPINKGDSGGPSFDTGGNVVGVNSMILAAPSGDSVGVAFAVPADTARKVIRQLRDKGSVTRGWIGVSMQSVTPDIAEGLGQSNLRGAIVASVQGNGPAAKAGLANGDVIIAVGGDQIKGAHDLTAKIQDMKPGSSAQLGVLRNGNQRSVSVTVGELPDGQGNARGR
ncbi:hypothetical protein AS156_38545 [Bradyrhizobium macuxiense]|uniref:Probable periplasmic serine endoprotease DegP-like n=2 Tax=Bradyrhizobium macuxiense TaxID=1755647 RepID=A0A109JYX9_9BRAD|nr:hypothetical protein AS156_38545 [Bradyrhizobium macuxiense]